MIDTYRNCDYATTEQVFYIQTFFFLTLTPFSAKFRWYFFLMVRTCINVKN